MWPEHKEDEKFRLQAKKGKCLSKLPGKILNNNKHNRKKSERNWAGNRQEDRQSYSEN